MGPGLRPGGAGRAVGVLTSLQNRRRDVMALPTPGFHHIMLNIVDPEAAIGWYTRQFGCTSKGKWGGYPALHSDNDVMVLFNKVDKPAPQLPQSAIWHFGWHVP